MERLTSLTMPSAISWRRFTLTSSTLFMVAPYLIKEKTKNEYTPKSKTNGDQSRLTDHLKNRHLFNFRHKEATQTDSDNGSHVKIGFVFVDLH